MGFFDFLRNKSPTPPEERDYSRVASPDPHQPEGRAPYIDAWVGYAPPRMQVSPSDMHTVGREPRQVPGEYPGSEQFMVEDVEWKTAPQAVQVGWQQAPDPRWAALKRAPLRPQRSPTTYRVSNPFDWQLAHHMNGLHFSMASHQRTYPIGGMQPAIPRRNTFRLMPPPHDVNQTNVPSGAAFNVSDMDMSSPVGSWRQPTARLR